MENKLPELTIEGTTFSLNVFAGRLSEQGNSNNRIWFNEMDLLQDGYGFWYDKTKKAFRYFDNSAEGGVYVRLNWLTDYDPEGMAARVEKPLADVIGRTDFEVIVDQHILQQRLDGAPVTLELLGWSFHLDYGKRCFIHGDQTWDEVVPFRMAHKEGHEFMMPFDPTNGRFFFMDVKRTEVIPEHIVAMQFPAVWAMDPVGGFKITAENIKTNCSLRKKLMEFPPKLHHVGRTVPWEKTIYRHLVRNAEQLPRKERNRGRGLI